MGKPIPIFSATAGSSAPAQNKIIVMVYDKYGFVRRYKHIPIRKVLNRKEIKDYIIEEIYISKIPTLSSPYLHICIKIKEKS
jgi:hypothetical protein